MIKPFHKVQTKVIASMWLALLGSFGAAQIADSAASTEKNNGICAGSNFDPRALDVISSTHIGWLRKGIRWSKIEKIPGQYDWADYDAFVSQAKAHGYKVLAILLDSPKWAIADQSLAHSPEAHKQTPRAEYWSRFVSAAIKHYGKRIDAWEVGNEPNGHFFFLGTLDEYRDVILKEGAKSLRAIDAGAVVVAPALATSKASKQGRLPELFKPVFSKGGAEIPDIISIHVYGTPREIIAAGTATRQIMQSYGIANKKLWLTEFGWNTNNVTEEVQKDHMQRLLNLNQQKHVFDKIFYYRLIDGGKTLTGNPDMHGILHQDLSPKPIKSLL